MADKLPQNLEAERSVLGAILLDNAALEPVRRVLEAADFGLKAHEVIFRRMCAMAEAGQKIDLVTLTAALEQAGETDRAGGPAYVASLVDGVPRVSNVGEYARIVKQKAALRKLLRVTNEIEQCIHANSTDPAVLAREFSKQLRQIEAQCAAQAVSGEGVDGAAMVREVEDFITRFVVLPPHAALPVALWTMATHCFELFDCFAYLLIHSPLPRCGKTRLLEVLSPVVANAHRTANISEAALFRVIGKERPTLMLDEAENLNGKSERAEYLRGILNAGNRQDAQVTRCVGKDFNVESFSVFCPKIVAGIGGFPAPLRDRSIVLSMQRRTANQTVKRFTVRGTKLAAETLRWQIAAFVLAQEEAIARTYSALRIGFLEDRDAEMWEALFALLGVADPSREAELQECARALCGSKAAMDSDDSLALRLLADLREVWPDGQENALSADLLAHLREIEEAPWGVGDHDLSPRRLARLLKPFGATSRNIRAEGKVGKGYLWSDLQAAFERYLPSCGEGSATSATTRQNTGENALFQCATRAEV